VFRYFYVLQANLMAGWLLSVFIGITCLSFLLQTPIDLVTNDVLQVDKWNEERDNGNYAGRY